MLTDGVIKTILDSGLTVLLKPTHRAPVGSFWVWYRVGSRNERRGFSGISHWVEHMMFRGTERFGQGEADRLIARVGGYHNAMTYLDWTAYFQTLPADKLGLALDIESDRMANAPFTSKDAELERTIILSERQGSENFPTFLLQEELLATSFLAHPYGHMTIGRMTDLETITREDLDNHYRTYYTPGNAVAVAVGDFEPSAMVGQIEERFGHLPPGPPVPPVTEREPPQTAERRVTVCGPGDTPYIMIAFHAPPAGHLDFFPLVVVDTLLGGARSMSMFDESEPSRSSRLYKALVDKGFASEASSYLLSTIDPYLFLVSATVQGEHDPALVEEALLLELERLAEDKVSEAELERAVHQTRAQFVYSAESVSDQGYWLGFAETVATLDWLGGFLNSLAQVTVDDVQRVARTYLAASRRSVGYYVPQR